MIACFDADGFLLFVVKGDMEISVPDGAVDVDVSDTADVNGLFLRGGEVIDRETIAIVADRTLLAVDRGDVAQVAGLPDPVWLLINGVRTLVDGGTYIVSPATPDTIRVEPTGAHRGNAIVIRAATGILLLDEVRAERDARLTATDWTQIPDNGLTADVRAAWTAYRVALRTLPQTQPQATLETVVWPISPEGSASA